ncbi:MAG: hypothetical protein IJP96_06955 [Synergistaceae bacterium]|nr:hypothetical protein [Synergistaceae bacterium]
MRINLQLHKALSGRKTKGVSVKKLKTETKTTSEDKKTITMPPMATTISEANEIAVKYELAKTADFTGLHLDRVNIILQTIATTKAEFPAMSVPDFVGNPLYSADPMVREKFKKGEHNKAIAWISSSASALGKVNGVYFNPIHHFGAYTDNYNIKENIAYSLKEKLSPEGCNTLKSFIDHELGHVLDYTLNKAISNDSRIVKLYNKHMNATKESNKMKNVLSEYAKNNRREFVAEAWAEYRNNPTPRPLATEVGKIIESFFKKS